MTRHGLLLLVPRPTASELPRACALCHPDERRYAREMPANRRARWVAGRLALAQAMDRMRISESSVPHTAWDRPVPILSDERGAPILPPPFVGSLSHVKDFALALVARDDGAYVGVDVENLTPSRPGIAELVATPEELRRLKSMPSRLAWKAVLMRFSLKEALMKAFDPWIKRKIGFKDVSILECPTSEETATFRPVTLKFRLREDTPSAFSVEAFCTLRDGFVCATVRLETARGGQI